MLVTRWGIWLQCIKMGIKMVPPWSGVEVEDNAASKLGLSSATGGACVGMSLRSHQAGEYDSWCMTVASPLLVGSCPVSTGFHSHSSEAVGCRPLCRLVEERTCLASLLKLPTAVTLNRTTRSLSMQ